MSHRTKYTAITFYFIMLCSFAQSQEDSLAKERRVSESTASVPISESDLKGLMDDGSVEKISYQLYLDKDWLRLSAFCDRALRMNFDYYYLRVRAGVASYELHQYRKSIVHFQKALSFNAGDDFANSYLYYSYLYAERFEDAKLLIHTFSPALKKTLRVNEISAIDFVNFESGLKAPDSSRQFRKAFFSNVSLGHSVANRVFLFHSLSYFNQDEQRFRVQQMQYYLKAGVPLKNGFLLAGGLHFVNVSADVRSFVQTVNTNSLLVYLMAPPGQTPPPPQQVTYTTSVFTEKITTNKSLNYIGALTLVKRNLFADYSAGITLAAFDTTTQVQLGLGYNFYPFKNNRMSVGGTIYMHAEAPFEKYNIAVAPVLNFYPAEKIFISISYLNNTGPNITENTGAFVSNSIDYTNQRLGLTASFNLGDNLWMYGSYGYEQKKHLTAGYKYDYNIFVLGIKLIPQFK